MIFLVSEKLWNKKQKKLVEPKDYIIVDALDKDDSPLMEYTNAVTVDNLAIPASLLKAITDEIDDDILDYESIKEMQNAFFNGQRFRTAILATCRVMLESNVNVFIIIRNKAYKGWRKIYQKSFNETMPEFRDYFWVLSNDFDSKDKDALSRNIPIEKIPHLKKIVEKKEEMMEREFHKKSKKSKKKNKKSRKNGLGFID